MDLEKHPPRRDPVPAGKPSQVKATEREHEELDRDAQRLIENTCIREEDLYKPFNL